MIQPDSKTIQIKTVNMLTFSLAIYTNMNAETFSPNQVLRQFTEGSVTILHEQMASQHTCMGLVAWGLEVEGALSSMTAPTDLTVADSEYSTLAEEAL